MNPVLSPKTVDAKRKITVYISAKHIKEGIRHNSRNCAIELAIEAAIPGARAIVNTNTVRILKPNGVIERFRNSSTGRRLVENFDNRRKTLPSSVDLLPIPPKSHHSKAKLAKRARARRASGVDFSSKGGHRKMSIRTKMHNQARAAVMAEVTKKAQRQLFFS